SMPAKEPKTRRPDSSDVDKIEDATLEIVIRILPELELSLASWDGLKHKPKELELKIRKYRELHESLSTWSRELILSRGKNDPMEKRVDRLWEFISLCRAIRKVD